MKVIGNMYGSWLVDDDVDETSDEYCCDCDHEDVIVDGDPEGECMVEIEDSEGVKIGLFSGGELVGKWELKI